MFCFICLQNLLYLLFVTFSVHHITFEYKTCGDALEQDVFSIKLMRFAKLFTFPSPLFYINNA